MDRIASLLRRKRSIVLAALLAAPAAAASVATTSVQGANGETAKGDTMKAVRIHAYGGREVLRYEDAPRPTAAAGQLLVRVHAAGINPVDWKVRAGMFNRAKLAAPMILGYDVSGVVEAVGADVSGFSVGDEMFAYLAIARGGGYAEYAVVDAAEAARKPAKVDHVHAAAVPLAALTAWQALLDHAKLEAGQTVLIHAGAGGVGHFAVQIARWKGAKVIATASARNHEFLKTIGADQVIDYRAQKFEEVVKDVDVVLDMIGDDTLRRSYAVVKKGGFVVSIVDQPDPSELEARGLRGGVFLVQPNGKQLAEIGKRIDEGKIVPEVSGVYSLADVAKAHERIETGIGRGKLVLVVVPKDR